MRMLFDRSAMISTQAQRILRFALKDLKQRGAPMQEFVNRKWLLAFCLVLGVAVGGSLLFFGRPKAMSEPPGGNRVGEGQSPGGQVVMPGRAGSDVARATAGGAQSGGAGSGAVAGEIGKREIQQVQAQLQILDEVLASKNDNDPRLDSELRILGDIARKEFREVYDKLAKESLNERGTVVFLLGRNLAGEGDFRFIQNVLKEPACKSLANCTAGSAQAGAPQLGRQPSDTSTSDRAHSAAHAAHEAGVDEVTLVYPQLMALRMIGRLIAAHEVTTKNRAWVEETLRVARESPIARVAAEARALRLPN